MKGSSSASTLISALLLAVVPVGATYAQDELTDRWSGSASLGAVITDGNSDTRNISGAINIARQAAVWRHNAFGSIFNAENNDIETANRFDLGYKLDREINAVTYGFGRLRFDSDDFANIDSRFSGVVGVGRTFFETPKARFSGEIGIGATSTDFISLDADGDGVNDLDELDDSGSLVFLGLNYTNQFTETVAFTSSFNAEIADINTYTVWDNSLAIKVSERLSLSLGLLTRSNSDILGALGEETDTATHISLVYGI